MIRWRQAEELAFPIPDDAEVLASTARLPPRQVRRENPFGYHCPKGSTQSLAPFRDPRRIRVKLAIAAMAQLLMAASTATPPVTYKLTASVPLGAPDRWDYVVYDGQTGRVYVAHGDRLAVVDARAARLVGEVQGIAGGTHGSAVSLSTGQGFTDDGRNGKAIAFDLKTLKITREIPADVDADAIAADSRTG